MHAELVYNFDSALISMGFEGFIWGTYNCPPKVQPVNKMAVGGSTATVKNYDGNHGRPRGGFGSNELT